MAYPSESLVYFTDDLERDGPQGAIVMRMVQTDGSEDMYVSLPGYQTYQVGPIVHDYGMVSLLVPC